MSEPQEHRKVSPVDQMVDSYRESLRTNQTKHLIPAVESNDFINPLHHRIKAELDGIKNHFSNTLLGYESELSGLQQGYYEAKQLIENEHRTLNELYQIKASAETLSELQARYLNLEKDFKSKHSNLEAQFESRQAELAQYISSERKQFDEFMFDKRQQHEHEMDSMDVLLKRRRKEFEISICELDKEILQKRKDWEREETLLEKEYHQRRLRFDQQMSEYESSFERKARAFKEKEHAAREEFIRKEQSFLKKIAILEEKNRKEESDFHVLEKQIKERRLQEDEAFLIRKEAFEKELQAYRNAFELDLENKQKNMMDDYHKKRDTALDQQHREEKEKLNYQLSEAKTRLQALQKSVEDARVDKVKQQELYKRELDKSQKEVEQVSLKFDSEKSHFEAKIREKIEVEFYKKLQEIESVYSQEILELKRFNNLLESQLNQERAVIKRMESGLRHSDIHTEQIIISSIENQQKLPLYPSTGTMSRQQRIVRTSRFKENR